jgi:hypothetical protein
LGREKLKGETVDKKSDIISYFTQETVNASPAIAKGIEQAAAAIAAGANPYPYLASMYFFGLKAATKAPAETKQLFDLIDRTIKKAEEDLKGKP